MEKKMNKYAETYMINFKNDIKDKMIELNFDKTKINELLEFIYDYERLTFSKDDFTKRKRTKNVIPQMNRCIAKRASGEQCTRRKKNDCDFCGTHDKCRPYGLIELEDGQERQHNKVEVVAKDINGIIYYVDNHNNVYKTEDIMESKENPAIVAKCVCDENGIYTIPEFNL